MNTDGTVGSLQYAPQHHAGLLSEPAELTSALITAVSGVADSRRAPCVEQVGAPRQDLPHRLDIEVLARNAGEGTLAARIERGGTYQPFGTAPSM